MRDAQSNRDGASIPPAQLEQAVMDALSAASPDKSASVTRDSAVLDLVDSLGLIVALGNLQAALAVELAPKQLIELFRARSIADFAVTLGRFVAMQGQAAQPGASTGSLPCSSVATVSDESQTATVAPPPVTAGPAPA